MSKKQDKADNAMLGGIIQGILIKEHKTNKQFMYVPNHKVIVILEDVITAYRYGTGELCNEDAIYTFYPDKAYIEKKCMGCEGELAGIRYTDTGINKYVEEITGNKNAEAIKKLEAIKKIVEV